MSIPDGQYKRLVAFQSMDSSAKKSTKSKKDDDDEEDSKSVSTSASELDEEEQKNEEKRYSNQARSLSRPDIGLFFIGSIGSILAGLVFPGWGVSLYFLFDLSAFRFIFIHFLIFISLSLPI